MTTKALWVELEARPGKEDEVAGFLAGAVPLVLDEPATTAWFALRRGPSTFGIFDAFPDDEGRQAHLSGKVAEALMAYADELLATPPAIHHVDVLATSSPADTRRRRHIAAVSRKDVPLCETFVTRFVVLDN